MDKRLLKAALCGDSRAIKDMVSLDSGILLGKTPRGNTCLHISSTYGHEGFCKDVVEVEESLMNSVNLEEETPLISAVTNGHLSLASFLLGRHRCVLELRQSILQQDKQGFNVLHHAIRNGHNDLALELMTAEPALSQAVSKSNESPMFIAVMRNSTHVYEKLMQNPLSALSGGLHNRNCLHAAVRNGDQNFAKKIMEKHPELAREVDRELCTPVRHVVLFGKIDILRFMLDHDSTLGYEINSQGYPLLVSAASRGQVKVARELLKHCPDAPFRREEDGFTFLHRAVRKNHVEFVEFILTTPELRKFVNMQDINGKTALHYAVQKCNPKLVAALLSHKDIDAAVLDKKAVSAAWELSGIMQSAKTLNWNEVCMLMLDADSQDAEFIYNLHEEAKQKVIDASRNDAKSLTETYTSNTSLVAILIATITFAAAFTLPGGTSSDAKNEGLPVMSKKFAFQAFLITDTLAMCSSFAVAFICVIAKWADYEFLIYYRSFTKKLMWFAYAATTTAFATGLYTVLAPHLHSLAITICVLVALLPVLTKLLGEWPILKLRFRLGKTFKSDLLSMV